VSSPPLDEEALAAAALVLEEFRRRLPRRCYSTQDTTRSGLVWISDFTGREPYSTITVNVREIGRSRALFSMILSTGTIDVHLPYKEDEVSLMTPLDVTASRRTGYGACIVGVDKKTAREAARVARKLAVLPPLDPNDALPPWRIL
jgi:hypothetical protein